MNKTINTNDLLNYIINSQDEKTILIDDGYSIFMNYIKLHNRNGTFNYYQNKLKLILKYLRNYKLEKTNQIDNKIIDQYVRDRIIKVKPTTINKEITALHTMMQHLLKKEIISSINFSFEKLPTIKTKIPDVDEHDIIKILKYFKTSNTEEKNKLLFLIILTTGVRTNEVINIQNNNIDLNNKRILLSFTKNKKPRYIYLLNDLIPLINKVKNKNTYLFSNKEGQQMTQNAVCCLFKRLKKELGITTLSPHKLRHYYATNVYKKSLDIYLVSKLLGHSNTKTTEIYLDVDEHNNQIKNEYYNPLNELTKGL